jgi:hypothetical protein
MSRLLAASAALLLAPVAWSGVNPENPVAYYSPDITRLVGGDAIFPSDAHRENESGPTLPQPAGLPSILTQLRGVNLDALARQNGRFVFSIDVASVIGTGSFLPGDVVRCDNPDCTDRTILLDALSDLPRTINVDAIAFDRSDGELLYSIDADAEIDGIAYLASDVIRWDGTNHNLEFDGRRLPRGSNLNALDATSEGIVFSVDVASNVENSTAPSLVTENHSVIGYNTNTQVFTFASLGPSGDWDAANLDALHIETTASANQLFRDGFESP